MSEQARAENVQMAENPVLPSILQRLSALSSSEMG